MTDWNSILWLVGIIGIVIILVTAIARGRGVHLEGRGAKLTVDAKSSVPLVPAIRAHGIKAGGDVVADSKGEAGIDASGIEAGRDVHLKARTSSDPKGR